jgi:methionyl-tRNA formyltransferase
MTIRIFGFRFFLYYTFRFLAERFSGRESVLQLLNRKGVRVMKPSGSINDPVFLDALRQLSPDPLISIAGNQIFKRPLLDLAPKGCLNLHSALLPKYRGLMPSFWVLLHGERETGISVFLVDEGIDSGPILVQKRIAIDGFSQEEVIRQTKALGMAGILEAIELIQNWDYTLIPNNDSQSSYFKFPVRRHQKLPPWRHEY